MTVPDVPFEEDPDAKLATFEEQGLSDAVLVGGVVIMGSYVVDLEEKKHPALIMRFGLPDGTLTAPTVLVMDEDALRRSITLYRQAVFSSIRAAKGDEWRPRERRPSRKRKKRDGQP